MTEVGLNLELAKPRGGIIFHPGDNMPWVMEIRRIDGGAKIVFNREDYPNVAEDDFAEAVISILELYFFDMPIKDIGG